jgi:hypothetical protein
MTPLVQHWTSQNFTGHGRAAFINVALNVQTSTAVEPSIAGPVTTPTSGVRVDSRLAVDTALATANLEDASLKAHKSANHS